MHHLITIKSRLFYTRTMKILHWIFREEWRATLRVRIDLPAIKALVAHLIEHLPCIDRLLKLKGMWVCVSLGHYFLFISDLGSLFTAVDWYSEKIVIKPNIKY